MVAATLAGFVGASLLVAGASTLRERAPVASVRAIFGKAGIDADAPHEIPPDGWWAILKRTVLRSVENRLMTEAGAVAFFVLLAVFPAMTVTVSLYGLFADPQDIGRLLDGLAAIVPGGAVEVIHGELHHLVTNNARGLSAGLALGLVVTLWSANQGCKALFEVLNVVYRETEKRSYVRFIVVTMGFTLAAISFVFVAMAAVVALPILFEALGLAEALVFVRWLRWPVILVLVGLFLSSLYRFGPSREGQKWRWVTWGGGLAAIAWVLVSLGFSWYVQHFGSFDRIYGSLGAAVGFITWIWLSTFVILCGAQLNAEMEHQTARDTTTGVPLPLGLRGAVQADTVA